MYTLSDQQIDFILADIRSHGIGTESILYNLLDHVCIIIERGLDEDGSFEDFYATTIKAFYRQELREIEEETHFLLTYKRHMVLGRNQFFAWLFAASIGPFIVYDIMCLYMLNLGESYRWRHPEDMLYGTFVFALYPVLTFLVLLLTPDRFDPLIPRRSKVLIGIRPIIKIIPPGDELAEAAIAL
jgi:hypothetical protein